MSFKESPLTFFRRRRNWREFVDIFVAIYFMKSVQNLIVGHSSRTRFIVGHVNNVNHLLFTQKGLFIVQNVSLQKFKHFK